MKLPEKGFPWNCGFDICRFPDQYCDDDEKRCGYCSEDVCNSGMVPEQCLPKCNSLSSITTPFESSVDQNRLNNLSSAPSFHWLYVISITALLLVLILYIQKLYRCCRRKTRGTQTFKEYCYKLLRNKQDGAVQNTGQDNIAKVPENNLEQNAVPGNTQEPTAPPQSGDYHSKPEYIDTPIVTTPEHRSEHNSQNLGSYNILPSQTEELNEVSIESSNSSSGSSISQALNEECCDKVDYNILNSKEDLKTGIQDTTTHSFSSNSNDLKHSHDKTGELTIAKEKTAVRPDKLC